MKSSLRLCPEPGSTGGETHDQARTGTPYDAARLGADVIVIGRTVTAAADPEAVAAQIAAAPLGREPASA